MKKPKPKSRDNVLSPEEREKILKACETDEERIVVHGLLFTGMRISEFLHMRKDWVDFDKDIISVPYNMPCKCSRDCIEPRYKYYKKLKTGEKIKLSEPVLNKPANTWQVKTKHAERPIPLLPEVKNLFWVYFKNYDTIMDLIWHRVKAWRIVAEVGKKAGIKHKVFPHCCRSTFASQISDRGMEVILLKDLMGWKDIKVAEAYCKTSGFAIKKRMDEIWNR